MSDYSRNLTTDDGVLLHLAVIEENVDVVRFLLKHGVAASGRVPNRDLALEFATDEEHRKLVESSLGLKIDGDTERRAADLDIDDDKLDALLAKTTTALHLAARNETKDLADVLLVHGAEVNAEMEGGETPLMIAVLSKRDSIVQLLLARGADVNAKTLWGKSALHYAAQTGQRNVAEMLLKHGAHVNAGTIEGLTPLHLAAEAGFKDVVVVLLRNEADYEIRGKNGATMLHYAAVMGHKDVLDAVVGFGADVGLVMKNGALDLSPFVTWVTRAEELKAWELVSRYVTKISIVGWYNTMVTKLLRKEKKGLLIPENERNAERVRK